MANTPLHLPKRQPRKGVISRYRWLFLVAAALLAVVWRTRTAISNGVIPPAARPAPPPANDETSAAPKSPPVTPAGEDARGVFRPAKAETDEFGVVITDDTPAGLERADGWVRGTGEATCPEDYPIKGNGASRIYHRPGEPSYEATIPALCFATEEDAQTAGYRARSK